MLKMVKNVLEVNNLRVTLGGHDIINKLNFAVTRDTTVAIIGANGSGKTTLFKTLLGLIPHEGTISWASDIKIGYVPQKLSVEQDLPMTVMEFLALKGDDTKKISQVLSLVGFKDKARHIHHDKRVLETKLGSLSGGELQRILVAHALLGSPNILLLDEPTAGVDIEGEETFYNLFERLKKDSDLTIIFISHDSEIVKKYADQTIQLIHEH